MIEDSTYKNEFQQIVLKIELIQKVIIEGYNFEENGLFTGNSGVILALNNFILYDKLNYKDKKIANKITANFLSNSFNNLEKIISDFGWSFGNGITGSFFLLNYLESKVFQNKIMLQKNKNDVNKLIFKNLEMMNFNNYDLYYYDLFNGKIGYINYLISISYKFKTSFINKLCKETLGLVEKIGEELNFGLAHGLPSLVIIFSKLYKLTNIKLIIDVTNVLISYILKYKIINNSESLYPINIIKNKPIYVKRLAWCYGDLGMASAFWQAGKAFNNSEWKEEGISIILSLINLRDLKESKVVDAGICHGTAGIAHIFNRFYKETGINELNDARWYWLNETLKMSKFKDGIAGYKAFHVDKGWQNDYGLLEGISGIGLVLLGFLTNNVEDLDWDRCLLLS